MITTKKIKILKMISEDMEQDSKNFEGQPFNGKTVAVLFGNQGAAISALADILAEVLKENLESALGEQS